MMIMPIWFPFSDTKWITCTIAQFSIVFISQSKQDETRKGVLPFASFITLMREHMQLGHQTVIPNSKTSSSIFGYAEMSRIRVYSRKITSIQHLMYLILSFGSVANSRFIKKKKNQQQPNALFCKQRKYKYTHILMLTHRTSPSHPVRHG